MRAALHAFEDRMENSKILNLRSSQFIPFKERNDPLTKVRHGTYAVPIQRLVVVVVAIIHRDVATPEERSELLEHVSAPSALSDHEFWKYLPTGFRCGITKDAYREASFPINETDNPSDESFLLIACPSRIITWHTWTTKVQLYHRYRSDHRDSSIRPNFLLRLRGTQSSEGVLHPTKAAFSAEYSGNPFDLRTVMVTAGVHQRFSSRLRPCGFHLSP